MAKYEVMFTRDVIQVGTLLVEAESSEEALAKAKRLGPARVNDSVQWEEDTSGAPYAMAASDNPQ